MNDRVLWKHCWNLLYYLLWVWVFYCIVICSKHGKNWEMKNLIFVIKLWYLMSQRVPGFGYVRPNMWRERALKGGEGRRCRASGCRRANHWSDITFLPWSNGKEEKLNCQIKEMSKGSEGHKEGAWEKKWNRVCMFACTDYFLNWPQTITHSLLCCCCCEIQWRH